MNKDEGRIGSLAGEEEAREIAAKVRGVKDVVSYLRFEHDR